MSCKEMINPHIVWACVVVYCWTTLMFVAWKKKVNVEWDKGGEVDVK